MLYAWPGALAMGSAIRAVEGRMRADGEDDPIHVLIGHDRRLAPRPGVVFHRSRQLESRTLWNTSPPRQRYEDAVLDVASDCGSDLDAVAMLAGAVQGRRTTAARMRARLQERPVARRRRWMDEVLADIADGTCSVLEREYKRSVERAHGLPRPIRQQREVSGTKVVYRDVRYRGLAIELDGRIFHDSVGARDRDYERDLDAAVDGTRTVRLSWGQVLERPCSTAYKIARLLQEQGWRGRPKACGPGCLGLGSATGIR